jgi:hypothetical protein
MPKSKKEIQEILAKKPTTKNMLESFYMLAVVRSGKSKDHIEIYLENIDQWILFPISEIIDLEEIDTVNVDDELCKLIHLEIKIPNANNAYQAMLKDALMSIVQLVRKDGCSCNDDSTDSHHRNNSRVNRSARRVTKSGVGSGNCYSCKLIFGRWWCITWATCLEATS